MLQCKKCKKNNKECSELNINEENICEKCIICKTCRKQHLVKNVFMNVIDAVKNY